MILDLDALRREADRWLRSLRPNVPLCPCEADYFRARFCLPTWLVDRLRRERGEEDGR
jgi:hypothetical protein